MLRCRRLGRLAGSLFMVTAMTAAACSSAQETMGSLSRAVNAYNDLLRWKKYDSAGAFRLPEDRIAFMKRYLAVEDDLHVESIEIRSVAWPPVEDDQPLAAEVLIVAIAFLLPSTVVEKVVILQRWEFRDGHWVIVESDRELAPLLDDGMDTEAAADGAPDTIPATEPPAGAASTPLIEPAGG